MLVCIFFLRFGTCLINVELVTFVSSYRSYGRYYYRNKTTGTIQWDFPELSEQGKIPLIPKKSNKAHKTNTPTRPKTPPPPTISDAMVPPPPPIISDHDTRKRKSSPVSDDRNDGKLIYGFLIRYLVQYSTESCNTSVTSSTNG